MRYCEQQGYTHLIVLDSQWFPVTTYSYLEKGDANLIGIVSVRDMITGIEKKYIGVAKGENRLYDEALIIACGATYSD